MKSFAKGLDVLAAVAFGPARSFDELASITRIPRSSLYRVLSTLKSRDFLRQDHTTGAYVPGLVFHQAGHHADRLDRVRDALRLPMRALVERLGESTYLYAREGSARICLDVVESRAEPIKHAIRPGSRFPLYAGASGKAILAFLPGPDRAGLLDEMRLARIGPGTLITRRELEEELSRIRALGYAVSEQELSAGAWAIAVPLIDDANDCFASLGIAGPLFRLKRRHIPKYARELQEVVASIHADEGIARANLRQRNAARERRARR